MPPWPCRAGGGKEGPAQQSTWSKRDWPAGLSLEALEVEPDGTLDAVLLRADLAGQPPPAAAWAAQVRALFAGCGDKVRARRPAAARSSHACSCRPLS